MSVPFGRIFDPKEFIEKLAALSRPDGQVADEHAVPPIGRLCLAFTDEEARSRGYVKERMLALASPIPPEYWSYHEDAIGNAILEIAGTDPSLPAIVVLSHIDSVKNGGRFDGPLGIVAGLRIEEQIAITGRPRRTFKLIATVAEESGITGLSCIGSRFLVRSGDPHAIARARYGTTTVGEHLGAEKMAQIYREWNTPGLDSANTGGAFEFHIEQSHLIALGGFDMAVVCDGIGGAWRQNLRLRIKRHIVATSEGEWVKFVLRFVGKPAHTGAMPPNPETRGGTLYRKDALVAACEVGTSLVRGVDIALIATRPLSESGFTIVPHDQEVQLLVRVGCAAQLRITLEEQKRVVQADFGVTMTYEIVPVSEASVSVCTEECAARVFDIPLLVRELSRMAFITEKTELGLTRATVTDLDTDKESAKLDGRDVNTEAGNRLKQFVDEHLARREVEIETISSTPYSPVDEDLSNRLARFAEQTMVRDGDVMRPLKVRRMPSGPGHDLGRLLDVGIRGALVFVRQDNEDETSHSPRETASWQHIQWALGPFVQFVLQELNS